MHEQNANSTCFNCKDALHMDTRQSNITRVGKAPEKYKTCTITVKTMNAKRIYPRWRGADKVNVNDKKPFTHTLFIQSGAILTQIISRVRPSYHFQALTSSPLVHSPCAYLQFTAHHVPMLGEGMARLHRISEKYLHQLLPSSVLPFQFT